MKNLKKYVLPITATAIAFGTSNCKGTEDTPTTTDRLTGQWEVTEADGDLSEMLSEDYALNLEFHMDGDAEWCQLTESVKACIIGEWDWTDKKETELEMTIEGEELDVTISIAMDTFEGDKITGEMTVDSGDYKYKGDVTLERVYDDQKSATISSDVKYVKNSSELKGFKFMHKN
jgi:hypothetical protein